MSSYPAYMQGCPGRIVTTGFSTDARIPSLTGLRQFDRVSHKKADEGVTKCRVCTLQPEPRFRDDAWARVVEAEAIAKEERDKRALLRVTKGRM